MRDRLIEDDPIYHQGYADGRQDALKDMKKVVKEAKKIHTRFKDTLRNPEELAKIAAQDSEINSALILAVMGLVMAEDT